MPPFDISAFRASFPEFNDAVKYPNEMIDFWVGLATLQVSPSVWKRAWVTGMSLYVAHELVLAGQNVKAASFGGSPGQQGGVAQTKTVGSATVGFDAQTSNEKDAAYWNLTTYGKQFIRLARVFGAQCIQL